MDIAKIKKYEMMEIIDFYYKIEEFGHVYHYPLERLDKPFEKILEGIAEVNKLMDNSFEM